MPAARSVELGAWLPAHVEEMLALPGFIEATTLETESDGNARIHCVQYVLSDQSALDAYLENDAERMRAPAVALFGDDLDASRAVRKVVARTGDASNCLNCQVELTGQYCWNCGQRGNTRLISLWELVRDAFGDLFEMDSRLWRTIVPLLTKPGFLTADYLLGRRARYMPPFRMYLVMSFIFFIIAQIDTGNGGMINYSFENGDDDVITLDDVADIDIDFDDAVEDALEAIGPDDPEIAKVAEEALRQVEAEQETRKNALEAQREALAAAKIAEKPELANARRVEQSVARVQQAIEWCMDEDASINIPFPGRTPEEWEAQARNVCIDIVSDRGRRISEHALQALPIAAIAVLPLLAMFLKFLYPLSRRYYVEHLLLLVHYHSFTFLTMSLLAGLLAVAGLLSAPEWVFVLATTVTIFYIAIYLYKAMRRVYGQGRFLSIIKYFTLSIGYLLVTVVVVGVGAVILLLTY